MPAFTWNPAWETGVAGIDGQHRELLHRMAVLAEHIAELSKRDVLAEVIETALYLQKYVDIHFKAEEDLMAKVGYPGLAQHREVHLEMRQQLTHLIDSVLKDYDNLGFSLLDFLSTWFLDHINTHDRQLAAFMRGEAPSRKIPK